MVYRRTVIAGLMLGLSGCVAPRSQESPASGDQPVLDGYTVSETAIEPADERYSDMDAFGLFLASSTATADAFPLPEEPENATAIVHEFIEATEFSAGERLVYVLAYAPETCYLLGLADPPQVSDTGVTVPLTVERTNDDVACGEAVTPVDILFRLNFDRSSSIPDQLTVSITGDLGGPTELSLAARA